MVHDISQESGNAAWPRPGRPADDRVFRALVLGAAALLAFLFARWQFCGALTLPDKPPRPEPPARAPSDPANVARTAEGNPIAYREFLERDSRRFGIEPPATPEHMAARIAYRADKTARALALDEPVEAAGLVITASVTQVEGTRDKQIVLSVHNPGEAYLAYHVVVRPEPKSRLCNDPPRSPHNAMTLAPGETAVRSECRYHAKVGLVLERVEVMELSPLSFHYVSRVPPGAAGIPGRLGRNHIPPVGTPCSIMVPAQLEADLESGRVAWRDVIDFYARHGCDNYRFFAGYRAFEEDGERPLPALDR